jgi:hypothetical protein
VDWRLLTVTVVTNWAHAAVAIVVVTWLVDLAVARRRHGSHATP